MKDMTAAKDICCSEFKLCLDGQRDHQSPFVSNFMLHLQYIIVHTTPPGFWWFPGQCNGYVSAPTEISVLLTTLRCSASFNKLTLISLWPGELSLYRVAVRHLTRVKNNQKEKPSQGKEKAEKKVSHLEH